MSSIPANVESMVFHKEPIWERLAAAEARVAELEALVRDAEETGRLSTEWGDRARLALKGDEAK